MGVTFSPGLRYQQVFGWPIVARLKRGNESWIQNECLRGGVYRHTEQPDRNRSLSAPVPAS